jgi:hypothetical protein
MEGGGMPFSTEQPSGPSKAIDCAWCAREFENVLDLLTHVEDEHLAPLHHVAA